MGTRPSNERSAIAFGPVPSRRLGRSLGINNVPPKVCSYACVYCQLGRTTQMQVERLPCYEPHVILHEVRERLDCMGEAGETADYLTLVADGEPTLDLHLGETIDLLRPLGHHIAVISNASLLSRVDVRQELSGADWVSVKVDAADEAIWRRIDRPHKSLRFDQIQGGLLDFAAEYDGHLVTETMLVKGVNDDRGHLERIARMLSRLRPAQAYVAAPTRPPAEDWVEIPTMETMIEAYQVVGNFVEHVEFLMGYEGNAFAQSEDVESSLLSITSVHPMRADAVDELLAKTGEDWEIVRTLVSLNKLVKLDHEGHTFYVRRLPGR